MNGRRLLPNGRANLPLLPAPPCVLEGGASFDYSFSLCHANHANIPYLSANE